MILELIVSGLVAASLYCVVFALLLTWAVQNEDVNISFYYLFWLFGVIQIISLIALKVLLVMDYNGKNC